MYGAEFRNTIDTIYEKLSLKGLVERCRFFVTTDLIEPVEEVVSVIAFPFSIVDTGGSQVSEDFDDVQLGFNRLLEVSRDLTIDRLCISVGTAYGKLFIIGVSSQKRVKFSRFRQFSMCQNDARGFDRQTTEILSIMKTELLNIRFSYG